MSEVLEAEPGQIGEAMPIASLVRIVPASNRLRNCVERADRQGIMPYRTVGEYMAAGAEAMPTLQLTLWAFGRRTAAELDRLVLDYASGRSPRMERTSQAPSSRPEPLGSVGTSAGSVISERSTPAAAPSTSDVTVAQVLSGEILSARLHGLLQRSPISAERAVDVLADFGAVARRLDREPNVGRHTVLELKAKLDAHAVRMAGQAGQTESPLGCATGEADPEGGRAAAEEPGDALERVVGSVTVSAALKGEIVSARLEGLLRRSDIAHEHVVPVLQDFAAVAQRLGREPNVGRNTIHELKTRLQAYASRWLRSEGLPQEEVDRVLGDQVAEPEATPVFAGLTDCCEALLAQEPVRNANVVRRRYGFDGRPRETLQEIAEEQGCTRERIRQLEAKSIRRFGRLATRLPLVDLLRSEWDAIWRALTQEQGYLSDQEVPSPKSLPPPAELAMDVLKLRATDCLGWIAERREHGWIGPPLHGGVIADAAGCVAALATKPLPRPLQGSADEVLAGRAAAVTEFGRAVHQDYLLTARAGPRVRRAVDAHSVLRGRRDGLDLPELADEVVRRTGRPCSVRDLAVVATALPHLFLRIFEDRWAALGPPAPEPPGIRRRIVHPPGPPAILPALGTIARAVADHLERHGPQRGATMFQEAGTILPPDRSAYSIGPVMLGAPGLFTRLLPGVWSLRWRSPDCGSIADDIPGYLKDSFQLRILALSRRAGEPVDLYPLWCPEVELALLRWAHASDSGECYRSLLATTDVETLPTDVRELDVWRSRKARDGRFELDGPLGREGYALPDPDRVLAAALAAREHGSCNWMMVNRVCGRRSDSVNGASVVALLLALGALNAPGGEPGDWQRPHPVTSGLEGVISLLGDALHDAGSLAWGLAAPAELLEAASGRPRAWVSADGLSHMLEACGTAPMAMERTSELVDALEDDEGADDDLPVRLGAERGEQLMRWLLDE